MSITKTTTDVNTLKINYLSEAMYQDALANNQINENELYMTPSLDITTTILNIFYPVGSYYETSDTTFDPNVSWGGTWSLETSGQVHISAGTGYTVAGALTNTSDGGETTHTLVENELPKISGSIEIRPWRTGTTNGATQINPSGCITRTSDGSTQTGVQSSGVNAQSFTTKIAFGNDGAHNNMQPYIIVNRWHRTA